MLLQVCWVPATHLCFYCESGTRKCTRSTSSSGSASGNLLLYIPLSELCCRRLQGEVPLCVSTHVSNLHLAFSSDDRGPNGSRKPTGSSDRCVLEGPEFNFSDGVYYFLLGLFLKAVCADHIADFIDPYWTQEGAKSLGFAASWIVAFLYSCQIFADFAGYSLMAIGLALLLGFQLPDNFRAPYLAGTFSEFWRRWHITLSSFLRDYLYIDLLGGNRKGPKRTYINLMATMLLGGLWHGPSWTFVAWGGLHGSALCVERYFRFDGRTRKPGWLRSVFWAVVVQVVVVIAWVMFRSPDFQTAGVFLQHMLVPGGSGMSGVPAPLNAGMFLTLPVLLHHVLTKLEPVWPWIQYQSVRGCAAGVLLSLILLFIHRPQGFIYFTF